MRKIGTLQLNVLRSLASHGRWQRGCGWVWDTTRNTERIMQSLVTHGWASVDHLKTYRVTERGLDELARHS